MAALRGSCLCGGVQFELPESFEARAFCHCASCKKLSGGVGTANGRLRSEEVTILEGEELLRTYQPEEGTAKTFCSVCGSNLFGGGWPDSEQASIRLSAIDDPLPATPGPVDPVGTERVALEASEQVVEDLLADPPAAPRRELHPFAVAGQVAGLLQPAGEVVERLEIAQAVVAEQVTDLVAVDGGQVGR